MPTRVRRLAVVLAGVGLASCSAAEEPDPAQVRADAIGELQLSLIERSDGALDEAMAACVAAGLVDTYGTTELEQTLLDAAPEGAVRSEVIDIFAGCDALDAALDVAG